MHHSNTTEIAHAFHKKHPLATGRKGSKHSLPVAGEDWREHTCDATTPPRHRAWCSAKCHRSILLVNWAGMELHSFDFQEEKDDHKKWPPLRYHCCSNHGEHNIIKLRTSSDQYADIISHGNHCTDRYADIIPHSNHYPNRYTHPCSIPYIDSESVTTQPASQEHCTACVASACPYPAQCAGGPLGVGKAISTLMASIVGYVGDCCPCTALCAGTWWATPAMPGVWSGPPGVVATLHKARRAGQRSLQ